MSLDTYIDILGDTSPELEQILTPDAQKFLIYLHDHFNDKVKASLQLRQERQEEFNNGKLPDFLEETKEIREDHNWQVPSAPADLQDRTVEITGPTDRKMVINALNSGANCYMADFEDSNSPTWKNLLEGQVNLRDAIDKKISFSTDKKNYSLNAETATLLVRPRGWHLHENHLLINNEAVSASLFDFGLFFYHNAQKLIDKGSAPYFYLPKLQSHFEARLWNDVFKASQDELRIPEGTIRATVLIETLPAAFEMEEILYELKDHSIGLNCGRWDYIFSYIKTFQENSNFILPDRSQVTMDEHFLKTYVDLLIQTCHKRGAHAMGGMAAQIPLRNIEENEKAMTKVLRDKEREARAGHDGTWIAHPGLLSIARKAFEKYSVPNSRLLNRREDVSVTQEDLLRVPEGTRTYSGLVTNVRVGVQYLESWLNGKGCVPLYGLMEDAATAEISRTQIWQWIKHGAKLEDRRTVTSSLFKRALKDVREQLKGERELTKNYNRAEKLFSELSTDNNCTDFLTIPAYEYVTKTRWI